MAGINLANILQNVESIKSARQGREINALNMQVAQKRADYMDADREFELGERQNMLAARQAAAATTRQVNELRPKVAAGDQQATKQFIALKPDEGRQILDAFAKMGEAEKKQATENIETVGRMAAYVLQSENPEQAYERVRQNISPELAKGMPQQYDRNFMTMQLARAREIEDLMKPINPKVEVKTLGDEDILFTDGRETERASSNALLKAEKSAKGDGGIKTADESLMYKMAATMFGGIADPVTGQIRNLTESQAGNVQAIAAEATRMRQEGEANSNSDAVSKAARKLKIDIQDLSGVKQGGTLRTFNPATGKFE